MTVAVRLVSPVAQTGAPFYFAQAFKKGDIPASVSMTGATSYQVTVSRTWTDGSAKIVHVSGRATLAASTNALFDNVPTVLTLSPGTPPAGTALTAASIQAAAPTATVQCGSLGAVDLSTLLATPFNVWLSGPEMVEGTYIGTVAGTLIRVIFYVKLYADGRLFILVSIRNGFLNNGAGGTAYADYSYIPTVTIGGTVVYTSATAKSNANRSTWFARGWIGTDPQVTPLHDPVYLKSTRLVPNYGYTPTQTAISNLASVYTPFDKTPWPLNMSGVGFQSHIGLLAQWDAVCVESGDIRARKASIVASESIRVMAINVFDSATNKPIRPSDFPNWAMSGPNQGGASGSNNGVEWEDAHAGSAGYVPYLLTGDQHHLEVMALQSAMHYLCDDINTGLGTSRRLESQVRGQAWSNRTISQYVAVAPTGDTVADDYRSLLAYQMSQWAGRGPRNLSAGNLGYVYDTGGYESATTVTAPWMHHFWIQSMGYSWDIEPGFNATDKASHLALRDFMYKGIVGILGGNGAENFCFSEASRYNLRISNSPDPGGVVLPQNMYADWGACWVGNFGSPNTACGNSLGGTSASAPSASAQGYWANLLPAISYAVDHGAPGAAESYARITGAPEYPAFRDQGFESTLIFGITPRGTVEVIATPTAGRSTRMETPAMDAARTLIGNPGLGLLGSEMATTGTDGPGLIAASITSAEANFEVRAIITQYPAGYFSNPPTCVFTLEEDGKVFYQGPTNYALYRIEVGGFASTDNTLGYGPGISRVDFNYGGGVPVDTTAPVMVGALAPSLITPTGFTLAWQAATDAYGVVDYEVSIDDGTTYVSIGVVLSHAFTALNAATPYVSRVRAVDLAGNRATPLVYSVTTLAAGDTIAPVMTGELVESNITADGFTLGWQAATDNNPAPVNYEVSIDGGLTYTNLGGVLTINVVDLAASAVYLCLVRAYDADGNRASPLAKAVTTDIFIGGIYIPSPNPYYSPTRASHFESPSR